MALIHSFEKEGKFLFRYRGQIPMALFIIAVPVIYLTDYSFFSAKWLLLIRIIAVALSVSGFLIRAYTIGTTPGGTSGRNREEQVAESLNSSGIYSIVRHPLYLGNYFMWIGIVAYTMNIWFFIIITLAFWLYYERIMYAEERFLERKFGQSFLDWTMRIPAFIPSFKQYLKSSVLFSLVSVLRREYSGFLATVTGFLFVDVVRDYFNMQKFTLDYTYLYVLGAALLITLTLRTLKHHTRLLHEEGRS